jgi:hypothetical protein
VPVAAEFLKLCSSLLHFGPVLRICITDPDPACHFDADADPDSSFHFDANPDPTFRFDAIPDPGPDPSLQIKAQNLEKVLE